MAGAKATLHESKTQNGTGKYAKGKKGREEKRQNKRDGWRQNWQKTKKWKARSAQ